MKKNLVKMLCVILVISGVSSFVACYKSNNTTEKTEDITKTEQDIEEDIKDNDKSSGDKKEQIKNELYQIVLGEEMIIEGEERTYKFVLEGIRLTEERNEFSEIKADRVFFVDYRFENIDCADDLWISGFNNLKIMDGEGNMLENYPVDDFSRMGGTCPIGGKSSGSDAYAIKSNSNKIKILFYDNIFDSAIAQIELDI